MQVYQLSIGAACGLSWPSDRIIIQVLDDSTDPAIKVLALASIIYIIKIKINKSQYYTFKL
jgi:hypothetical protein